MAAWSGIRPLVRDPKSKNTESLARNHIVDVSKGNLVTIAGGKWTTYRSMASDTVDEAVKSCHLQPESTKCQTDGLILEGGVGYSPNFYIKLVQDYKLDIEVAKHLSHSYGTKAIQVCKEIKGPAKKLAKEFPYIEAEVKFAIKEYACTVLDVLARRMRLAFLDVEVTKDVIPRVVDIMASELKWSSCRRKVEMIVRQFEMRVIINMHPFVCHFLFTGGNKKSDGIFGTNGTSYQIATKKKATASFLYSHDYVIVE